MFIELQLKYLLWLQNLRTATNDFFTPFFSSITSFGEYLIIVTTCAIIYWCINKKLGILLVLNCATALLINHFLKNAFCLYRPWMLDSNIKPAPRAIHFAGGYSFPSGHSALAVSCWGCIGTWYNNIKKILLLAILLPLIVAFSRNYLGVHTIQDVIVGLLTSVIILALFYKIINWCEKEKNRDLIIATIITIISSIITAYIYFKDYPIDYDAAGNILISPERSKLSGLPKLGLILGTFWGWCLEQRFIKFDSSDGHIKTRIIRGIIGMTLLTLITFTKSMLFKYFNLGWGGFYYTLTVGLYITFIYPCLYEKFIKKALPL